MKFRKRSVAGLLLASLALGCSNSSSESQTAQSLNAARQAIKAALPAPSSEALSGSSQALSVTREQRSFPAVHEDYASPMSDLSMPGGCDRPEAAGPEAATTSPQRYAVAVLEPTYGCTEDGEIVSTEEVDAFGPTVFGRFEEETKVIEFIQDLLVFENGIAVAGTYQGTFQENQNSPVIFITAEVSDFTANDNFDSKIVAIGRAESHDGQAFFQTPVWIRFSGSTVRLAMIEDCRTGGDLCDGRHSLGFSYFNLDQQTNALQYEYASISRGDEPDGSEYMSELQRLFRGANEEAVSMAHMVTMGGGDEASVVLLHAAEGQNSEEFSVSFALYTDDEFIQNHCTSVDDLTSKEAALCEGSPALNAEAALAASGLNWARVGTLFEAVSGEDESNLGSSYSDVFSFWPAD